MTILTPPEDNDLARLTLTEFHKLLETRKISVHDYIHACADRIEKYDNAIGAFEIFDRDQVEDRARRIDAKVAKGDTHGTLIGTPIGVKDIFNTYDYPAARGTPILAGYTPGNDARCISDLRLQDGIVMGKTVTAEFAVHHAGRTVNPMDHERTPGTSSSGSAAAVAAHMVPLSVATQTAGSIIRPASYCGVMGFKPSFGLIPRTGVLKTTDTLDTVGFMGRSVSDLRTIFDALRVKGRNFPISETALLDPARQPARGQKWRVGIIQGPKSHLRSPEVEAGFQRIIKALAGAESTVEECVLTPEFSDSHDMHDRIYCKSLAYYFKDEYSMKPDLFSASMTAMMAQGREVTLEQFQQDLTGQERLARLFDQLIKDRFDVVIDLSTADEAPIGLNAPDPEDHCLIWTMCGTPAISVPLLSGQSGLPIGVQIVARKYSDYMALAFAEYLSELVGQGQ